MLKIRLMRIGAKKRPFFRVVAIDERKKRSGEYLELLGTYNPLRDPKEINLKQERIDEWVKKGAQLSDGVLRILGKAPQKPPRKPKKAPKEELRTHAPPSEAMNQESREETVASEEAEGEQESRTVNQESREEIVTSEEPEEPEESKEEAKEEAKEGAKEGAEDTKV